MGVESRLYAERAGLDLQSVDPILSSLRQRQLLVNDSERLACTEKGHIFLNSVLEEFL